MRRIPVRVAVGLAVVCWPGLARAYFEASEVGTRALGLANAFVSVVDDASAVYWNPAGLVQLRRNEWLVSIDHTPDLTELHDSFAAMSLHTPYATLGIGWQHDGVEGALAEDQVYLSAARGLVRRSLGAFVSGGATLKLAHLGLDRGALGPVPGLSDAATGVTGDVGLLLAPIPNVTVGATVRNLVEPSFDLLAGGGATRLGREFEWGASLRWRQDGWLHFARRRLPGGHTENRLGAELRLAGTLGVEAGIARDEVAAGIDVRFGRWRLDTAYRTQDALGVTYRVGLRCGFGKEGDAVGGTYDEF